MSDPASAVAHTGSAGRAELVVLTPDVAVDLLLDERVTCLGQLWRDGLVRPVVTRMLLGRYLRTLGRLGLGEELLRRWAWWFGSPAKCLLLDRDEPPGVSVWQLCLEAAAAAGSACIVHGARTKPPSAGPTKPAVRCVSAGEYVATLPRRGALP